MTVAAEAEKPVVGTHRKAPFLRRVQIRNYKSIKFCDVTLEPLTVFVGRNGSGKSNFVDAIGFLRDVIKYGMREGLKRHGTPTTIANENNLANHLSLSVEFEHDYRNRTMQRVRYSIDFSLDPTRGLVVERESFKPIANNNEFGYTYQSEQGTNEYLNAVKLFSNIDDDDSLLFKYLNAREGMNLLSKVYSISSYRFNTDTMRMPKHREPAQYLSEDGNNLTFVYDMMSIDSDVIKRIQDHFSHISDGICIDEVVHYGSYSTIRFSVPNKIGKNALQFDAESMSDGTLRIFASLVAAYQSLPPYGPPSFVAIEEPEAGLHPAAMHALVDALDEATGRTQILLTTHSTELLDNPRIKPENVRVVEMIDGETVITPVDEASLEIVKQKLDTLGGLERQNQLEINQRDLNRQRKLAAEAETK